VETMFGLGCSRRLVALSRNGFHPSVHAFALRDPVTLLFHLGLLDPVVAIATVRWTHGAGRSLSV
jgi:hypothetical protein